MKRNFVLFALLGAMSPGLAVAQDAPADPAPEAKPEAGPDAQPAPTADPAPPPQPKAGPTPATASPVPTPAPTTTAPAPAPRASTDASGDPTAALAKSYPFRSSTFILWQNLSATGLHKGAEQTWNPMYSWLARFTPRYYLTDTVSVRAKFDLGIEWTNGDETTTYHEAQWEDTWLDLVAAKAWVDPLLGIDLTPSWRFVLPTSKASQARGLYAGLSPGFSLHRDVPLGHDMNLSLSYSFRYIKNLNRWTTVQYEAPTIASCSTGGAGLGDCGGLLHTGSRNPSHVFQNILVAEWAITPKLHLMQMAAYFNSFVYGLTPASAVLAGGTSVNVPADPNTNVNMRAVVWYLTEVSYDVHPWLTVGLGLSSYNPQLNEESKYRTPFVNRYTEIMLGLTFALDRITASIDRSVRTPMSAAARL